MPDATATQLDPLLWDDLLGAPYALQGRDAATGIDCLGLVLEVHRRMGFDVGDPVGSYGLRPERLFADHYHRSWELIPEPRLGCAVLMRMLHPTLPDHVGILVARDRVLEITLNSKLGVMSSPLPPRITAGRVIGYFWPLGAPTAALPGASTDGPLAPGTALVPGQAAQGQVRVVWVGDLLRMADRGQALVPWAVGACLLDYVPERLHEPSLLARTVVWCQGRRIARSEYRSCSPVAGDEVVCIVTPGIPVPIALVAATGLSAATLATIGNIIIFTALSLLSRILFAPQAPDEDGGDDPSPTFSLNGIRNTVQNGTPKLVVYGEHRVGGHILTAFFAVNTEFRSTLYMLLSLGEGQVEDVGGFTRSFSTGTGRTRAPAGEVTGRNITVDGNALEAYGSVRVSTRVGTARQHPIPGFEEVINAVAQAQPLRAAYIPQNTSPQPNNTETFYHETTQPVIGFELHIQYPNGLYKVDQSSGDFEDWNVRYTLRYQRKNWNASEVVEVVRHGPSRYRADHTRTFSRRDLAEDVYEIRITRLTVNDEDTERRTSMGDLIAVNEIRSTELVVHQAQALVGIEALGTLQLSGAIPTITTVVKGKRVWVWDGVSTTAPNFTHEWSDSPAWICLDILLNPLYGLGNQVQLNDIDLQSFKDCADYCAEQVVTDGVTHDRWQFDSVFDAQVKAWDAITVVVAACRCSMIIVGGKYKIKIERAGVTSQLFGMGNTVRGSAVVRYLNQVQRPNMVQMQYRNRALDYSSDVAQLESPTILSTDLITVEIGQLRGITRAQQAYRAAKFILNVAERVNRGLTFLAPIDAVAVEPGDLISFHHDRLLPGAYSGRLNGGAASASADVKLDVDIVVPASPAWSMIVRTYDSVVTGQWIFQVVTPDPGTYAAGTVINTSPSWDANALPRADDVYAVGPSAAYQDTWRVTALRRQPDQLTELECLEYDAAIYDDDPGVIEAFTEKFPGPRQMPLAPTGLRIVEVAVGMPDRHSKVKLSVSWASPASAPDELFRPGARRGTWADLWLRSVVQTDPEADESHANDFEGFMAWQHVGSTTDEQFVIEEGVLLYQAIEISVTCRSPSGARLDPRGGARRVYTPFGATAPPSTATAASQPAVPIPFAARATWVEAADDFKVVDYEVRQGDGTEPRKFWLSQPLAGCVKCPPVEIMPHQRTSASYQQVGSVGGAPQCRSIIPHADLVTYGAPGQTLLSDQLETATWPGTKVGMTLNGTVLEADLTVATGTYQTLNTDHPLEFAQSSMLAIYVDAYVDEVLAVVEAGYPVNGIHAKRLRVDGLLFDNPDVPQQTVVGDVDFVVDSPMAQEWVVSRNGMLDSVVGLTIEYDLATDAAGTVWVGFKEYSRPVLVEDGHHFARVKLTFTQPTPTADHTAYRVKFGSMRVSTLGSEKEYLTFGYTTLDPSMTHEPPAGGWVDQAATIHETAVHDDRVNVGDEVADRDGWPKNHFQIGVPDDVDPDEPLDFIVWVREEIGE